MNYFLLFYLSISFIIAQNIPDFDSQRAMTLLKKQCELGPRFPGSVGHKNMKIFLEDFLKPISDTLLIMHENIPHPYQNKIIKISNFYARFNIEKEYRFIIMAHWDTREIADLDPDINKRNTPIIGANDGASGTAAVLALAEIIHKNPLINIGIDLLLVDAEDMGRSGDPEKFGLGTQAFAKNIPRPLPQFAICLDMIADQEPNFPIEQYSLMSAPELVQNIWTLAQDLGFIEFENRIGHAIMDDHYYLTKHSGIPAIDIIDFEYPNNQINYWHTTMDIPENCSEEGLEIVGEVITHFIYNQDQEAK